jgi:hypothetical protein
MFPFTAVIEASERRSNSLYIKAEEIAKNFGRMPNGNPQSCNHTLFCGKGQYYKLL